MSHKHEFSNLAAVIAADQRAAVHLVPAAETPEERAAASATAIALLDQAVRACIAAGRHDVAGGVVGAQQQMAGVAR
ncbi:hypothetical protein [Hydrogenophaga intermedia]|uniref:hypothetical protein n=1 Tax=Hydrogenophaga intermedia TaxID=65786 RepID=UPI00204331DF|nr:hypothetical protein [Hydrogenophaga intermedia]MCM3565193.1 hypothetical protein [Hydrogenophaga intermedia]